MIALDTSVLVYAHREDSAFHRPALACLEELVQAGAPWAIPWPCVHEFLSIVTHPRVYNPPTPTALAIDQVEAWIESPSLALLGESHDHWAQLKALIQAGRVVGPQVHDARIAALCVQHGVRELWSVDRDFGRFPQLRVSNPLVGT